MDTPQRRSLADLQQAKGDAKEDTCEPELVGEPADPGSGARLEVVDLDRARLHSRTMSIADHGARRGLGRTQTRASLVR